MNCEKCGRPVNKALQECSYREQGECPYEVKTVQKSLAGPGCAFFAGVISTILSVWMLQVEDVPGVIRFFIWAALLIGVGLILGGLVASLRKEVVVFHRDGENSWSQVTILGKPISEAVTSGFRKVVWAEGHIRKLRFPASVVELARSGQVIPIVSTTLTHLLDSGVIEVGVISTQGTMGSSKEEFFFMPGKPAETSEITGELEKRILDIVALSAQPGDQIEYRGKTYQRSTSPFLSLKDLLLILFEGEKRFPRSWLMEEVVGKQAIELGFGEYGKLGHEKIFKFFDNTKSRLDVDIQTIDLMYKELWKDQPSLGPELHSQIDYLMVTVIKDKSFFL